MRACDAFDVSWQAFMIVWYRIAINCISIGVDVVGVVEHLIQCDEGHLEEGS